MSKRFKKYALMLLAVLMCLMLLLGGCGPSQTTPDDEPGSDPGGDDPAPSGSPVELAVAGAGTGSTAYTMVAGLAENVNTRTDKVRLTAETTAGFVENIRLIGNGNSELGLAGDLQIFQGLQSIGPYEGEPAYEDLRGVAAAYEGHVGWNATSDITSISQLAGKRVSAGPPGSQIAFLGEAILDAYGVKDQVELLFLAYDEGSRAFVDGELDAFMGGPSPYPCVVEAGAQKEINILPVGDAELAKIQAEVPAIRSYIPATAYDWLEEDVPTVGYISYLIAHKDVPDDAIYALLEAALTPEGIEYLKANHTLWNMWNTKMYIEEMNAFQIPGFKMHPGAVKYWSDQGVNIPDSIKP